MTTILVTGGTGFLGKQLGLRLHSLGHEVILAGRNNGQNLRAEQATGCRVLPLDVCRIETVRDVMAQVKPAVIIHAAATKFVDMAERLPMEAIDVNVTGSQNVARVAIERGIDKVIGISTDKASPPIRNTYGLTKALMERMYCALDNPAGTRFLCVRYGNVAWSTGSVLPIWRKMLADSGVIETTGPEMLRFFFTVEEAVSLVLAALERAHDLGGQVVTRDMKAAKMEDILTLWTQQAGARFERIAGRPGDRQEEYLFGEAEVPFTRRQVIDGVVHYIISFNNKADSPVAEAVSSANAERLTKAEILALINNPPEGPV